MTHPPTPNPLTERSLRAPVRWGVVWGVIYSHGSRGEQSAVIAIPSGAGVQECNYSNVTKSILSLELADAWRPVLANHTDLR